MFVQFMYTIDEKHHCDFLCSIIRIGHVAMHLKNRRRWIIIRSFNFNQIANNWDPINRFDGIEPWRCGNSVNISSNSSMLIAASNEKLTYVIYNAASYKML